MPGANQSRRIVYVWLPHLQTEYLTKKKTSKAEQDAPTEPSPCITVKTANNTFIVDSANQQSEFHGIFSGMTLAQARALVPHVVVERASAHNEREALVSLARSLERFTPFVGIDPPCGIILDISGCAHLFGGEESILYHIVDCAKNLGFKCKIAVADNVALAWGFAHHSLQAVSLIKPNTGRQAIGKLPVGALNLPEETLSVLLRLGMKTVDDVFRQPRSAIVKRFGPLLARRMDLIDRVENEPISPLSPVPTFSVERRFAEPIFSIDAVLIILGALAQSIAASMNISGVGAKRLSIHLFHCDGMVRTASVGAAEPLADPTRMLSLFHPQIESLSSRIETDSGIDLLRLTADEVETALADQQNLYDKGISSKDLAELVDILSQRLGAHNVQRFTADDTHEPYLAGRRWPAQLNSSRAEWSAPSSQNALWSSSTDLPVPRRPLRMFEPPEPIDALASVPDGPPVRFVWRHVFYYVAAAEGPERISPRWWVEGDELTYDYFCIEDVEGRRFWVSRKGLYERETDQPLWYMNGLFG